jgi:site-specific DNA recombinase
MAKAIIYCRVSSQDQTHGTSLDNQQRACLEYAENKGIQIARVFVEKGESATAANRTELIKALDYCKDNKGDISAFIVWKLDRFARNMTDHYGLQAQLLKYGTSLHSVTEEIISEGPVGKMLEAMLAGYAQFENDIRKQRCQGGMRARLRDGISPWMPPIGYTNSKNRTERRKLTPDQPDVERFYLVQKGLRAYATGEYTISQLAEESNRWGLRTRTDKPMRKQLWEKLLTDKFYAGILTDPWSGVESRGLHKPMISLEEYEQIQAVKKGLSNNATNRRLLYHPDFPLRGTVRCSCGSFLTASWQTGRNKKKYPRYRCHNSTCTQKVGISKKDLEKKFAKYLKKITPDERFLQMFEQIVIDEWKGQHMTVALERDRYEKMVANLEEQKRHLIAMRANKEISKEELAEMRNGLDNQLTGLRIAQNEALTNELDLEVSIEYAKQFVRDIARQWQDLTDPARKANLQRLVLPKGIAYDKNSETFCTAVLSPVFKLYQEYKHEKSDLVEYVGFATRPSLGMSKECSLSVLLLQEDLDTLSS